MLVFLRKNTRIHKKMGEIHELSVLALFLVWFAGATPELKPVGRMFRFVSAFSAFSLRGNLLRPFRSPLVFLG